VAACKKYKGIVFTDKDSNIINNTNDPDTETDKSEPYNNNIEITGVDDLNTETTRVDDINHTEEIATTPIGHNTEGENGYASKTTGVSDNNSTHEYYKEKRKIGILK